MKKTISIATLAAVTAATAAGAVAASRMEFRPRKDVIEPTVMTVAAETNAVNPEMFAASDAAANNTAVTQDFLGGTRSSYTAQHSGVETNRQASRSGEYTGKRNHRKNNSYNPERNVRMQGENGSVQGYSGANQGYNTGDSKYHLNRMSDYGNYMNNQLHGGYGNPFEGRTDCRTYKLRGDVYIVIPEASALDMLGTEYHGPGMHHNRGRHTGVPDGQRAQVYDGANRNVDGITRVDRARTDGTRTTNPELSTATPVPGTNNNTARSHR